MIDLVNFLIKGVTGCDKFEVEPVVEGDSEMYNIKIPQDYVGLVIGKKGKMINSLRNLVKIRAALEKKRVNLNVLPVETDSTSR